MSLYDTLMTWPRERLAKELQRHARDNALLQEQVHRLKCEVFWLRVEQRVAPGVYRIDASGAMDRLCEVCGDSKADGHGCFCGGPEKVKYGKVHPFEAPKMIDDFDDAKEAP